jgi:branched-chain amino acid transport system substrate-binding protein
MKYTVLIIALLLILAFFAGCTQQAQAPAQPKEIKIGAVVSMTGPNSNIGKNMWQSATLAADEINANGGIFVKQYNAKIPIKLVQGDDESTREGGQKAVTKLITDDKVDILIGGYSSAVTSAYEQTVAEFKVPYVVTGASSPIITHRTDIDTSYVFHHCPTTDAYGMYTTNFIDQVIRPTVNKKFNFPADRPFRLALLYQDTGFGIGVKTAVNDTITKNNLNIKLVSQQSFKMGESDFRTALTTIKAANPDAVYVAAAPNEGAQIIPQARRDVGLNTIFLNVENNDAPEFYKGIGQYGEYAILESRFSPYISPKGVMEEPQNAFKNKYFAKWGANPDMMGASTYEGTYIAAKAIENAGTLNKTETRQALSVLKMPEIIEHMKNDTISFSKDYRECQFDLWMEQLYYNATIGETRPTIVWPDVIKTTDFALPDWYKPGSA